ncbi:MAG: DUF1801 domain-containing protein [Mucilaginibacter polytrichastri]|nr:DUF1801 domain-containing protein [Mucilaginibacter polytrichastri]
MPEQYTTIDEYIAAFPEETQKILQEVRETIHAVVPEAKEAIKYAIPTFILNGNLVHFAGYKHHIGFYRTPNGIEAFEADLSKYKRAKGSVQFPIDKPMPHDLIRRIVEYRVEITADKKKGK